MKADITRGSLTCVLALFVSQACLADYPESWQVRNELTPGVPQPIINRNVEFDARMAGTSYNGMVSGTACEFTILTNVVEGSTQYDPPDRWTHWRIKSVEVKINGIPLALDQSELEGDLSEFESWSSTSEEYTRRIRWATNEFAHGTNVTLTLTVVAQFSRWLPAIPPSTPPERLEISDPLPMPPLTKTLSVYNKALALATTVMDTQGTLPDPNLTEAQFRLTPPGVAETAANDARAKLTSAKHLVFPGIHHDRLDLAQYLDQGETEEGNDPKLKDTTAFFAMTHGLHRVIIFDKDTGEMHQSQNIEPVTKPPDPNDPGPFDRTVPPMNFAWFYVCTLGEDNHDWRRKLNINSGSGALFGFKNTVNQLLDPSSIINLDVPVDTELTIKLSEHSAELLTKLLAGFNASVSLSAANDLAPPRRPSVLLYTFSGQPFWRYRLELMSNYAGDYARLVKVYNPEGEEGVEVYGEWYCIIDGFVPPGEPGQP